VGFLLGGFIPTCYAQTFVEIAKLENQMKAENLKASREHIKQNPETIAYILGTDLQTYLKLESGELEISNRVAMAFNNLLTRYPGSNNCFAVPTIEAITKFKETYYEKYNRLPIGFHNIEAPWKSITSKEIDFTPFDKYTPKTKEEMIKWIDAHDVAIDITPEYFNSLTIKTDAELNDEVQFWDEIYTAQHYGRYKSREPEAAKKDSFIKKFMGQIQKWNLKRHTKK
jgi:hypothetical protein